MVTDPASRSVALPQSGLSSAAAAALLAADGPNELAKAKRRSSIRIAGEVIREPMLALLLAGGVAYLLLGDLAEALILMAFAIAMFNQLSGVNAIQLVPVAVHWMAAGPELVRTYSRVSGSKGPPG